MAKSLDLTRLLPTRYRDKTLDSLLKNLFNCHLSKSDTAPLFGYVGDTSTLQAGEVAVVERDLERQLNQLTPMIYAEHATEKKIFSWPDLLQKLVLQGVNYEKICEIFTTKSYNFVPPIDLDKFANFNEYFWVGQWLLDAPSLPWDELGIPVVSAISPVFARTGNTAYAPEYYVIERGEISGSSIPLPIAPNQSSGWSDWSLTNLWVHRDDVLEFLRSHGGDVGFEQLVQATRPIIEYLKSVSLNTYQTSEGIPADTGTYVSQQKIRMNQIPLFDLYDANGTHLNATSGIFYYNESAEHPVDSALQRRVVRDENDDFVFGHSLVAESGELYFYKNFRTSTGSQFDLYTVWREGEDAAPRYIKYDATGTLINQDKFINYRNYYWTAVDATSGLSAYNLTGLPEYYVIESSGTSGWANDNFWKHVSELKRSDLSSYVQAERPIIEFNVLLEQELYVGKTSRGQLPVFKHYRFDDVSDTYIQIPSGTQAAQLNMNDAYAQNKLLARLTDLPNVEAAVRATPEILANTFEFAGSTYIQGLSTGKFVPELNGVTYGYRTSIVSSPDSSKGSLNVTNIASSCTPQVITFTWNANSSVFNVRGSVTTVLPNAVIGMTYTTSGVTLTLNSGSTSLDHGDSFVMEIKTSVYEREQLYVKMGTVYRTLTSPDHIITERQERRVVEADIADLDGVWEVPPQIMWNAHNETRSVVKQGDLYYHFTKIIKAQPLLVGSEAGKNNWRSLTTKNVGLGGTIKQYDGNVSLLVSMLLQEGVTVPALVDFARESYEKLSSSVHTFIERQLPHLLLEGSVTLPTSGDAIDPELVAKFKEYFASASTVVQASSNTIDDVMSSPFYDTTSSISSLVVTLPYLGLTPKVLPQKKYDLELGLDVLVHHDGHIKQLPVTNVQVLKDLVTQKFERSPGQTTQGFITGVNYPNLPYKSQFWFKTTTIELFYYNVVSDTGEQPTNAVTNSYSYNRSTDTLYQYNGTQWNIVSGSGAVNLPWTKLDLGLIEQNLLLALETELYNHCPTVAPKLNTSALQSDSDFQSYLQQELEAFGVKYGVTDVYASNYDATNSLTWNYSSVTAIGASAQFAAWDQLYNNVYGTPRPDLQPWIPAGYGTESSMIDDLVLSSIISGSVTEWDPSLWSVCASYLRGRYSLNGVTTRLSINVSTGELLGPYGFGSTEQLVSTIPASASDPFEFGDYGPVESFWRKTLNYLYSLQKIYYKLNPRSYMDSTWGIKQTQLGEYTFNALLQSKDRPSASSFHGDELLELISTNWINVSLVSAPSSTITYRVTCVHRLDGVFKVTSSDSSLHVIFNGNTFTNSNISLTLTPESRDFFFGDAFSIRVTSSGIITVEAIAQEYFRVEGLNQLFVQYNRLYGQDLQVALNKTLFTGWKVKLGYRFGALINTDTLTFKNGEVIDQSAVNVYLKENKFYNSTWINAVRVQLAVRGSTDRVDGINVPRVGPAGTPGEDFVFRIDSYNPTRSQLTWMKPDLSQDPQTFIALDGSRTLFPWEKYPTDGTSITHNAPFLITGIQNLVNFLYGYAEYTRLSGWKFDVDTTPRDQETNRPIDYQLLIEKTLDQLFSGAEAGSAFIINPFSRRVTLETPRGTVSSLNDLLGIEQETVCAVLDVSAKRISTSNLRVFRQDGVTEIISDIPIYTLHLLTSEYEHVALFENYSVDTLLIYDTFLGQKSEQMFVKGERQADPTGRIDFGGHFLLGDQMKRNLESSVQGIAKLYDGTVASDNSPETERARSLLGFQKKAYFEERGTPDPTEFRFWQGMISNKGTNFAIDAFTNSAKYNSSKLDEYWAYKVAEYGDARPRNKPELKVEPEDATTELSNYLFVEDDDLATIRNQTNSDGYDVVPYDTAPYDGLLAFNPNTFYENTFDPRGTLLIRSNDEQRWHRYEDLKAFQYFEAEPFVRFSLTPTSLEHLYVITDATGKAVRADVFELIDTTITSANLGGYGEGGYDVLPYDYSSNDQMIYRETGDYILNTDPPEYSLPKFKRINHTTIQILDSLLLNRALIVVGYRPAASKYSPIGLYNYITNTTVRDDVIWWDPARDVHHPEAIAAIDYQEITDPARYNVTVINARNINREKLKPWGEGEVGKIWWNRNQLSWKPYSDVKLVPDFHERLASWGALSDRSSIEVYEWVKSSTPPEEYDGEAAIKRRVLRTRSWDQRVVAWKHSQNPLQTAHSFKVYQPAQLKIIRTVGSSYAVLKTGSFEQLGLTKGVKIAGALYSSSLKLDSEITEIFGVAEITSQNSKFIIGSSAGFDDGAVFASSPYFTFNVEAAQEVLQFRDGRNLGAYTLRFETDPSNVTHVRLTHVASGDNQAIEIKDTPVRAGTAQMYLFDQLGLRVTLTPVYGHADTWPTLGSPNIAARKTAAAQALGDAAHQIFVRSKVEIFSPIDFQPLSGASTQFLPMLSGVDPSNLSGWVAWSDPESVPADLTSRYNQYVSVVGRWVPVGTYLPELSEKITSAVGTVATITPYRAVWSNWSEDALYLRTVRFVTTSTYTADDLFQDQLSFPLLSAAQVQTRVKVYINETLKSSSTWSVGATSGGVPYLVIEGVNPGDLIRATVDALPLTPEQLSFDPEVEDDPLKLVQYKHETPYVYEVRRDEIDNLTVKNYYFWVKNKSTPAPAKSLPIKQIASLLHMHDGTYAVPQVLKFFNQIDGRPNRYSALSVKKLGQYVRRKGAYKLRLGKNSALRDDDNQMNLKNVHVEWKLLRPLSPVKLPKKLWDLLTDTMVGENQLNQSLPSSALELYDSRNLTEQRYGFTGAQVLTDPQIARDTLKYTVLNTRVDKYVNGALVPDYISYLGFDVNQLDAYLSSSAEIRKFMADLWRFAKPKQINEIFFAVLEDALTKNLELTDFFKTSFISLSEVRNLEQK